jgi:hypothetical protein
MWEFRRDPHDLTAEGKQQLEELFRQRPRLRPLYELRVRFKQVFDTTRDREQAEGALLDLLVDMVEEFPELDTFLGTFEAWEEEILRGIQVTLRTATGGRRARPELRPENVQRILLLLFDRAAQDLTTRQDRRVALTVWASQERAGIDFWYSASATARAAAENLLATPDPASSANVSARLPLVRRLCESCGGQVSMVPGSPDEGITFRLDFRRKQPRATRQNG